MAAAHPFGSFVGCRFKRIGIARLQETTSQCALTLCHAVLRVLRLRALVGPALRPPAPQCAPGLTVQIQYKLYSLQLNCTYCNYTEAAATCSAAQQHSTFAVQIQYSTNCTVCN